MPRVRLLIACLILIEAAAILAVIPNFAVGMRAASAKTPHPFNTSALVSNSSLVTAVPPVTSAHMPEICGGTIGASHAFVIGCSETMPTSGCVWDTHSYLVFWGCVGRQMSVPGLGSVSHQDTTGSFFGMNGTH